MLCAAVPAPGTLRVAVSERCFGFALKALCPLSGWTTAVSRTIVQIYYINEATSESTYELPQATYGESSQSTIFDEGVPPDERE